MSDKPDISADVREVLNSIEFALGMAGIDEDEGMGSTLEGAHAVVKALEAELAKRDAEIARLNAALINWQQDWRHANSF